MDHIFLKSVSENYISDNYELELEYEQVFEYLKEGVKSFRKNFFEFAEELKTNDRLTNTRIAYHVLDIKYNNIQESSYLVKNLRLLHEASLIDNAFSFFKNIPELYKQHTAIVQNPDIQFLTAVVQANYNNCNKLCTPSDLNLSDDLYIRLLMVNPNNDRTMDEVYNIIRRNNNTRYSNVTEIYKISKCIRLCNLDYLSSLYAQGVISYERCMKELSGNDFSINTYKDILIGHPFSDQCHDLFEYLTEIFNTFNKLLDIVYARDSFKKNKWLGITDEKVKTFRSGRKYNIDFHSIDDSFEMPFNTLGR